MTKGEILNLFKSLNQLGALKGVKFAYGVSKNLNILKPEIESLEKANEASDKFKEFEKARIDLIKEHCKKDDKGKEVIENNEYVVEDKKEWEKAFNKLKKEHQGSVDEREKQIKDYMELLKTDSKVDLYKIKLSDVPNEITTMQMNSIINVIEE